MKKNEKFYEGFWGEPSRTIRLVCNGVAIEEITTWHGYFDEIIRQIKPEEEGWTGLAYYYHLCIGWEDEENWFIPDLPKAYEQLKWLDTHALGETEKELLGLIVEMLETAIRLGGKVYIVEE